MDRRFFLRGLGAAGCSAAAFPWLSTLTLAGSPAGGLGDNRLIAVILRGGMDGLDAVRPVGDAALARLRPTLLQDDAPRLDDRFALHPRLAGLMPLWQAGELGFVHATSTPYRDKRSHFDGQDLLEAGLDPGLASGGLAGPAAAVMRREGWLNRLLQAVPGLAAETALAVGREALPLLAGRAPTISWMPDQPLPLSAQGQLLLEALYHDEPLFRDAVADAMMLAAEAPGATDAVAGEAELAMAEDMDGAGGMGGMDMAAAGRPAQLADIDRLADFAAARLRETARIAALSLAGWDTHRAQANAIRAPLTRLERLILRLRAGLGPEVWGRTLFVAMTEFGRTVAENGTGGTDHGTGGVMVLAGGALRGGRVFGRWPGLAEADLYDRRDLMPTSDVRGWAGWALRGLYGFDRAVIEGAVFPGLDLGSDPRLLL